MTAPPAGLTRFRSAWLPGRLPAWRPGRIRGLTGWRAHGLAAVCGALAALALPPWHLWPVLWPAFSGLLLLVDGRRPRAALALGWSFGLGHFLLALHWIAWPMLVDSARHAWLVPFAVGGLAGATGLFPALACALYARIRASGRWPWPARVLAFAGCWLAAEWLRRWALTGFPWALTGYAWAFSPAMSQLAAVAGIYGLSWLTVCAATAPAGLVAGNPDDGNPDDGNPDDGGAGRRRIALLLLAFGLPGMAWAGGLWRLAGQPLAETGFHLRLVQAHIAQRDKWVPGLRAGHLDRHVTMSRSGAMRQSGRGAPVPDLVIWPEAAVPFFLASTPDILARAAEAVPANGFLVTGAPRVVPRDANGGRDFRNSAHVLTADGRIVATYDKRHLVPFGEYVPGRRWLPLERMVAGAGDFSPGPGLATLRLPGLPAFGPLICYEAIFPAAVVSRDDRPDWLLNITNDAWFGPAAGPAQHFAIARMRAVEEGLPLVRSANTGISAVIDRFGRVRQRLDSGVRGVIDARLPPAGPPTPFARLGDLAVLLLLGLTAAAVPVWRRAGH